MNLTFQGPAGRLSSALWTPAAGEPRAAAVVAHPHPLHGGTMRSSVVHCVARGLRSAGLAVLRFDFRGVGESGGAHEGGAGEEGDLSAALDELTRRFPGLELWASGFSFGARIALAVAARDPRVARALLVAPPVTSYACAELATLAVPGLLLTAGEDPFGRQADVLARFPALAPGLELEEIEGADHLFAGALPRLEARVGAWAARALSGPNPSLSGGRPASER